MFISTQPFLKFDLGCFSRSRMSPCYFYVVATVICSHELSVSSILEYCLLQPSFYKNRSQTLATTA